MSNNSEFEFLLFYSNVDFILEGIDAGIAGIVVDLETKGKEERQASYNTQVNKHDISDIKKVRRATASRIICRINGGRFLDRREILSCIEAGADEILVPMITSLEEIDLVSAIVNEQAMISVMIETNEAIQLVAQINEYPLYRVFVGLNDLSIANNQRNLFMPLADGTVDYVRKNIPTRFGVAGLTHPNLGSPVNCRMLINEMKRLGCTFGFLRRSYYADLKKYSQKEILGALKHEFSNVGVSVPMSLEFKNYVLESNDPFLLKAG